MHSAPPHLRCLPLQACHSAPTPPLPNHCLALFSSLRHLLFPSYSLCSPPPVPLSARPLASFVLTLLSRPLPVLSSHLPPFPSARPSPPTAMPSVSQAGGVRVFKRVRSRSGISNQVSVHCYCCLAHPLPHRGAARPQPPFPLPHPPARQPTRSPPASPPAHPFPTRQPIPSSANHFPRARFPNRPDFSLPASPCALA
ncbi:unnamed protein product [Closterium sp. NIES-54]